MALQKHVPASNLVVNGKSLSFPLKMREKAALGNVEMNPDMEADVDVDHREIYFLIMHFLSDGPCQRTCGQFWNELLEYDLLPRRYHAWYSRRGMPSGDENDNGLSFPLSYNKVVERYAHIGKDHLIKLLKQLLLSRVHLPHGEATRNLPNAADVPTLLGTGSFSLLGYDENKGENEVYSQPVHMRWPHMQADQVRGLRLREIGGGFARHHRAPSTRAACYTIAKPSTMVQKIENVKKMRGHRNAVYCAVFDCSGRFVITGSDDRLVKIWSMETAYCLASCRGHEGDITDLAVTSNNAMVASSSNDCIIRTWRLPDGQPISVLRGHTSAVTAIAFSPRPSAVFQLLSSADDGTCRLWDARYSQFKPRIYLPKPSDYVAGKSATVPSIAGEENYQIFCCAFNASGTVFVTGSSDNLARVWNACKSGTDDSEQPIHEMDVLSGHENDVNYVQFSGCAVTSRCSASDTFKEENFPKFKNSWFAHDNIVTCSRDGSAIIWIPRSRKSHGRAGRWTRAYHLKVPPPPMPPQPQRGGPRQRVPPTPRGVNMIVWSLDNRFVLAAIMDCRICVWNASDGSLVHCLTGHTDSTYVLDVHPFNPRIAMSAGYDGKTIIWDIWEGKPIRIYDIGRFKLVDGKFSPDGTSIILSDDVGQLYILSTGQGESQKDAMYDQFFLGDYRPLIRDTHGNVIDQETQIPPHRRNMQDLLCDSSMIPYPEPYQSLYQQRRLGTLGIEWRPSSVRFAVGPDFSSDQDQIFPLPDLDVLYDPLPDFMDVMEWEPEVEVISDDTDSEFNVTESFGGDGRHISSTSSGNSECDEEDSEAECSNRDNVRRSRRRKKKRETEIITSSGRRIKRRNLDACDGSSHRIDQYKKSRNGRKRPRKKSLKASRPRRAAARNALTLFSKIKGGTPDQGEYCSDGDSSESESVLEDSNFESEESDKFVLDERAKNLKGKEVIIDDSEDTPGFKEFPDNAWNKRRLILKFPVRDPNISSLAGNSIPMSGNVTDLAGSSSSVSVGPVEVDAKDSGQDGNNLLVNGNLFGYDRLGWLAGYGNDTMKWGGVRARTSKRIKFSEPLRLNASRCSSFSDIQNETDVKPHVDSKSVIEQGGGSGMLQENTQLSHEHLGNPSGLINANKVELSDLDRSLASDGVEDEAHVTVDNGAMSSKSSYEDDVSTLFNSATKKTMSDLNDTSDIKSMCGEANERNGISFLEQRSGVEERKKENHHLKAGLDSGDCYGPQKTDEVKVNSGFALSNSQDLHSQKNDKMYSAVYRRSRSFKTTRTSSDSNGCHIGENKLNANCQNQNGNPDKNGILVDCIDQSQSVKLRETAEDRVDCKRTSERLRTEDSLLNKFDRRSREDWGSSMTVGLRSTRNRRVNFVRNAIPVERRKASQSQRKLSWLMLSVPDGSRYIPQQCDEVAYLRQGHEEYISCNSSFVRGPWVHLKGEIRAVEFCKVMELEYSIFPGSGETCCKMTLEFIDPNSSVFGKTFKLTLPEVSDFPDFLVERSRYETAMERKWTRRDKCQVWWKNEDDGDGSWWEGRIYEVKPKSLDFPGSPWEKYSIRYKSDPTEIHSHSPWELHDPDDTQWELPHLDDDTTNLLLSSLSKLLKSGNKAQDTYGVHKLQQVSVKSNFLNRFPVPLSLEVILSRLENNYYRSLEAVKHDIKVMLSNAETYFLKNTELSRKIGRLSDWFESKIMSL